MATEADISDLIYPMKIEVEDKERNNGNSKKAPEELIGVEEKVESSLIQPLEVSKTFATAEKMQVENVIDVADVHVVNEGIAEAIEGENFLQSPSVADGKAEKNTEEDQLNYKENLYGSHIGDKIEMKTDENILVDSNFNQNAKLEIEPTDCSQGIASDIGKVRDVCPVVEEKRDSTLTTEATLSQQDSLETSFKGEDECQNKSSESPSTETVRDESLHKVDNSEISKQESDQVVKDIVKDNPKDKPEALTMEYEHEEVDQVVTKERVLKEIPDHEEPLELEQSIAHKNEPATENVEMLVTEVSEEIETTPQSHIPNQISAKQDEKTLSDDVELLATPEETNITEIDLNDGNGAAEVAVTDKSGNDSNATAALVEEEAQMTSEKLNQNLISEIEGQVLEVTEGSKGEQEDKTFDKVIQTAKSLDENADDQVIKDEEFKEPNRGDRTEEDLKDETLIEHATEYNSEITASCTQENETMPKFGEEEEELEESSTPKAPENKIGNGTEKPEGDLSFAAQTPQGKNYEEKLQDSKNCVQKADIAPERVAEAISLTEVKPSDKPIESQLLEHEIEKEDLEKEKNLDAESESKFQNVHDIYETTRPGVETKALDQGAKADNNLKIAPCQSIQAEETAEQLPALFSVSQSSEENDQTETKTTIKDEAGLEGSDAVSESKDRKFEEPHETATSASAEETEEVSENNEAEISESMKTPNFHDVEDTKEIQDPIAGHFPTEEEKEETNPAPETGITANTIEDEIANKTETEFIKPEAEVSKEFFSELTPESRVQCVEGSDEIESKPPADETQAGEENEEIKDVPETVSEPKHQGVGEIFEREAGEDDSEVDKRNLYTESESTVQNAEEDNEIIINEGSPIADQIEKSSREAHEALSEPSNQIAEAAIDDNIVTTIVATEVTSSKEFQQNEEPVNVIDSISCPVNIETTQKGVSCQQDDGVEKTVLGDASSAVSDHAKEDKESDSESAKVDYEAGEAKTAVTISEYDDRVVEDAHETDLISAVDGSYINEIAKVNKVVSQELPEAINEDAEAVTNEACGSSDQSFEETPETKTPSVITEEHKMGEEDKEAKTSETIEDPEVIGLEEISDIKPTPTGGEIHAEEKEEVGKRENEITNKIVTEDIKSDAEEAQEAKPFEPVIQSEHTCVEGTEAVPESISEEVGAIIGEDIRHNQTPEIESKAQLMDTCSTLVKDQHHETPTEVEIPNSEVPMQYNRNRAIEEEIDEENIEEKMKCDEGTDIDMPTEIEVTLSGESKLINEPINVFGSSSETITPESIATVDTSKEVFEVENIKLEETSNMDSQVLTHESETEACENTTAEKTEAENVEVESSEVPAAESKPFVHNVEEIRETKASSNAEVPGSDNKETETESMAEKISATAPLNVEAVMDDEVSELSLPIGELEKKEESSSTLFPGEKEETEESKVFQIETGAKVLSAEDVHETETTTAVENTHANKMEEKSKEPLGTAPESKCQDFGAIIGREILSDQTFPLESVEGAKDEVEETDIAPKTASKVTNIGEIKLTNETAKDFDMSSDSMTPERPETVDTCVQASEVENIKPEETCIVESKLTENVNKIETHESVTAEKTGAHDVEVKTSKTIQEPEVIGLQEISEIDSTLTEGEIHAEGREEVDQRENEITNTIVTEDIKSDAEEVQEAKAFEPVIQSKHICVEETEAIPEFVSEEVGEIIGEDISHNQTLEIESKAQLMEPCSTLVEDQQHEITKEVEIPNSEVTVQDNRNRATEEIDEESIEEKMKCDERTDIDVSTETEVTLLGTNKLINEPINIFGTSLETTTPESIRTVDTSKEDSEVDDIKLGETSTMDSQLLAHENEAETCVSTTAEKTDAKNVEVETLEVPAAESESLFPNVEEIHETKASSNEEISGSDNGEAENERVAEKISASTPLDVEAVIDDEVSEQSFPTGELKEHKESSSSLLSIEKDETEEYKVSPIEKEDNVLGAEVSGTEITTAVENTHANNEEEKSKEALETEPESKYQDFGAMIDREILSDQIVSVEGAKDGVEETDISPTIESKVTNIGEIKLSNEAVRDFDMSSDSKTPERIETVDTYERASEVESIKPAEAPIVNSKLAENVIKIEVHESVTAAETKAHDAEVENWKVLGAESESLRVEEVHEANPSLAEPDATESGKVAPEVPKSLPGDINQGPEADGTNEIAPSRMSQAENIQDEVQISFSAFLSSEESNENETNMRSTEDDSLQLQEASVMLPLLQNIKTLEASYADETKAEEVKGFTVCESKDHFKEINETKTSPTAEISEDNIVEKVKCHEGNDNAVTSGTEVTLLEETKLINDPIHGFCTSTEITTPDTIQTVDTSKQDSRVNVIKLEETSILKSQLRAHENEQEACGSTILEKIDAENIEVENSVVPAAESESSVNNVEEIHKTCTSPAMGDIETSEIEEVVREVPEIINPVSEAGNSDDIALGQKTQEENKGEQDLTSSFVFLASEESQESEAIKIENMEDGHMKKGDTEEKNLKSQEDSGVVYQLQNTDTVEESDTDVVKAEEATGFHALCESRDHFEEICDTKEGPEAEISGADKREEEALSVIEKQDETEVPKTKLESNTFGVELYEATTAGEKTHGDKVEEEIKEALETIPGPKCHNVETIIDREILSNKTFPLEDIQGTKDGVEETDIAPRIAIEVPSIWEIKLSDEPVKSINVISDSETPETIETFDTCQPDLDVENIRPEETSIIETKLAEHENKTGAHESVTAERTESDDAEVESIKPEESSIVETNFAEHENKIEAHERVTAAQAESDDAEVENQKVIGEDSESPRVEDIHEENANPAVGEIDTNQSEKVVQELPEELPEALPGGINQGPEADRTDEIAPSQTSQAENIEEEVQNSSLVFLPDEESRENETSSTKNMEDDSFKLQETSGMLSQLQNTEAPETSEVDEVKTEETMGTDAVCESNDHLEETHETKTSLIAEIADEVKIEEQANVIAENISETEAVIDDVPADESTGLRKCPTDTADINANTKHPSADEPEEAIVSESTKEPRVLGAEEIHETETSPTAGKTHTDGEEDESKTDIETAIKFDYEDTAEIIDRDIISDQNIQHENKEESENGVEGTDIAPAAVTDRGSMGDVNLIDEVAKASDTSIDSKISETIQAADSTVLDSVIERSQLQEYENEKIAHEITVQNVQEIDETITIPTREENDANESVNVSDVEETKSYSFVAESKDQAAEEIHETGTGPTVGGADMKEIGQETTEAPGTVTKEINQGAGAVNEEEIAPIKPIEAGKIEEQERRGFDPIPEFKDRSFEEARDTKTISDSEVSEKTSGDPHTGVETIVTVPTAAFVPKYRCAEETISKDISPNDFVENDSKEQLNEPCPALLADQDQEITAKDGRIKAEGTNQTNDLLNENVTDLSKAGTTVQEISSKPVDEKRKEAFDLESEKIKRDLQPEFEIHGSEVDPMPKETVMVDEQHEKDVATPREDESETHIENTTEAAEATHETTSKEQLIEEPGMAEANKTLTEAITEDNSNAETPEQVLVGTGTAYVGNADDEDDGKYVEKEPIAENEGKEYENLVQIPDVTLGKHEDKLRDYNEKDGTTIASANNLETRVEKEKIEHDPHVPAYEENDSKESVGIGEQEATASASDLSFSKTTSERELEDKGKTTIDEKQCDSILDPPSTIPSADEQLEKLVILPTADKKESTEDAIERKEILKEQQKQEKIPLSLFQVQVARKDYPNEENENMNAIASKDFQVIPEDSIAVKQVEQCEEGKLIEKGPEIIEKLAPPDPSVVSSSEVLHKPTDQTKQITEEPKMEAGERGQAEHEKIYEEEEDEKKKADLDSDAPVMVEASRDIDVKTPQKKSHNILSGVGSKMKHSISKVKKAITGKSSHQKASSTKEEKKTEAVPLL